MLTPHITDADGWLSVCCIGFMACLVIVRLLKGSWRDAAKWVESLPPKWKRGKQRTEDGFTIYWPYVFGLFVVSALVGLGIRNSNVHTETNLAIVRIVNPYRFTFQHVDAKLQLVGDRFTEDICRDYDPPGDDFREGLILTKLIHTEGKCWSLHPDKHCGFLKLRGHDTKPIFVKEFAKNEYND
jgi:hypothetical protein